MSTPIPQPAGIPFLGNIGSIDREVPNKSFALLAATHGEIYRLNLVGRGVIVVNTQKLVNEVSDETRFRKHIAGSLFQVRNLVGDGLFTAFHDEPNWAIAHRLLMPAFGTTAIRDMLDDMRDIAGQLLMKWERFGPEALIDPSEDFTKLALDTIALASMSYRLNSFYTESAPPFANSMGAFLQECFARSSRPALIQAFKTGATNKYQSDISFMRDLADKIVSERKANPVEKPDLLNKMLKGRDAKTGLRLSDENIGNNLLTFLIAGHETTSGTLSFITYYLMKHPEAMRKLRDEIDTVIGDQPITFEDLSKLVYTNAVIRETMRLQSTVPMRSVAVIEDTTLDNGKYAVKAGETIATYNWVAHRDPAVWGDDAEEFKPERMLDGKFEALPKNSWQPFGYGLRGCIGRPFAWQEMLLVLASIFQKFDLVLADDSYTLDIKQSLTIKPKDFHVRAIPRADRRIRASSSLPLRRAGATPGAFTVKPTTHGDGDAPKQPLYVLYGSNTGTSEGFAQRIANDAASYGFRASMGTLDSAVQKMPTDGPVIIVTASFEGEPADNAAHYVEWLKSLQGNELKGVSYGLFGCGNKDWVQTYQFVPTLIDAVLEQRGANRLLPRGAGDASDGQFFQLFDTFEAGLWETLSKVYGTSKNESQASALEVNLVKNTDRAADLRQPDAALGTVIENRVLSGPGGGSVKRHLEFALPAGMSSRAGDYLAILPHNPPRDVHRVLSHFKMSIEQEITIASTGPTSLPVGKAVNLSQLLMGYVELSQPATTKDLSVLVHNTTSETTTTALNDLAASHAEEILAKRISVLDLLERYADITLPLSVYLQMIPAMRIRQYSISSSPLWDPTHVTLTISVLQGQAISGKDEPFLGVASTYLASLRAGDKVFIAVRPSSSAFHLPADPTEDIVMFCAGSGVSPFRGFIQERATQKANGRPVGKMLLFFGCRDPEVDYLYSDTDLKEWASQGVVDVRPAFSRKAELSEGCKHVQDRILRDQTDVHAAYQKGAKFYTCGSAQMAAGVKAALLEIVKSVRGLDDVQAKTALEKVIKGRYATDVFD